MTNERELAAECEEETNVQRNCQCQRAIEKLNLAEGGPNSEAVSKFDASPNLSKRSAAILSVRCV